MKLSLALFAAALCVAPLSAQVAICNNATPAICSVGSFAGTPAGNVQVRPQAVPVTPMTVTTFDAYLQTITVTNPTGAAITFTLSDKQGVAVAPFPAVSVAANTTYIMAWPVGTPGYWCPNGFTVAASGAGLTWYGAWRQ